MTDCARCGDCCETIWLSRADREVIEDAIVHPEFDPTDRERFANSGFLVEHWAEVERIPSTGATRYVCSAFDPVTRMCTAHEDRPPVCRDFPWYSSGPHADKSLSPRCSFWAEVPPADRPAGVRPLLPLVPLTLTSARSRRTIDQEIKSP